MPSPKQVGFGEKVQDSDTRPIKIVRILSRLNIGGPSVHAVLLTEGLNNQNYRSTLVTGRVGESEGNMLYFAGQHGVTPLIVSQLGRGIFWRDDLVALWKLYRILRKEKPDIVHTHAAKAGVLGRIAAVLARVPIRIHTFHGHIFHGYFGPVKTRLFILIERALAFFTNKIVAISHAQLVELSSRFRIASQSKFKVIPVGLDLTRLLPGPEKERQTEQIGMVRKNERGTLIGFVGRLVPIKNPLMALKVFELLFQNMGPEQGLRMIVVGDGELKPELEDQVRQTDLEGQVEFTGWLQDLSHLYQVIDLVIVTSHNEGTPVVLIEAMAAGVPFVATKVGGILDLVVGPEEVFYVPEGRPLFSLFGNGALAEPGDVEGFTAAVEYLLSHRERMMGMGSEGMRFVKERFSKERLVKDVEELYRDCLQGHPRFAIERSTGPFVQKRILSLKR